MLVHSFVVLYLCLRYILITIIYYILKIMISLVNNYLKVFWMLPPRSLMLVIFPLVLITSKPTKPWAIAIFLRKSLNFWNATTLIYCSVNCSTTLLHVVSHNSGMFYSFHPCTKRALAQMRLTIEVLVSWMYFLNYMQRAWLANLKLLLLSALFARPHSVAFALVID